MHAPTDALDRLADSLRHEDSVISAHVGQPSEAAEPVLGMLAAAGPRAAAAPDEYALVIESVREGYLLHYGGGRIVAGADADLALLAGDYLYALGLERLAAIGDLAAVRELSDLISLAAQTHGGEHPGARARAEADALWLACTTAIAAGSTPAHEQAKASLRAEQSGAGAALLASAEAAATAAAIGGELGRAAEQLESVQDPGLG
jgi:hypothetical protein